MIFSQKICLKNALSFYSRGSYSKNSSSNNRSLNRGFTLLEIIMVIVILGILMTFLLGNVFDTADKAKSKLNGTKMEKLKSWINLYSLEYNQVPQSLQSLVQCDSVTGPACAPSASEEDLKDPWGTPYKYTLSNSGSAFELKSLGSDRKDGGSGVDADVTISGP
jgi:general secretion pathway protein G